MFTYLKVQNFALIDDVEVDFKTGFTAFVGETGAGKSLLVDAIDLLSGTRSSASFVKAGTDAAIIQGSFFLDPSHTVFTLLQEQDIVVEDNEEILVQRQILADGRTTCKIQGTKVPATFLKTMMHELVDIHGQHENSTLLNNKNHLSLLDNYAVDEQIKTAYQQAFKDLLALHHERKKLKALYDEIGAIPTYEQQIAELVRADVKSEEISEIGERLQALRTFNRNFDAMVEITQLFDSTRLIENLYQMQRLYASFGTGDVKLVEQNERLNNAYYELQDIEAEIKQQVDGYLEQKAEQEKLEQRINTIFSLQKKYGDDLLVAQQALEQKVQTLQNIEYEYLQLEKKFNEQSAIVQQAAQMLHDARQVAGQQLATEIMQQLQALYMDKVEFTVHFTKKDIGNTGFDQVEFYIKTNVGSDFQPLNKIASGGELSRIMLAIKIVFAKNQALSTIIFDEIDTGVSGAVAEAIARKMRVFSQTQQVFAITHLPQVLAASHHQLLIEKFVADNQTHIKMRYLTTAEHEIEVAKMLSGAAVSEVGVQHAQNLIQSFN